MHYAQQGVQVGQTEVQSTFSFFEESPARGLFALYYYPPMLH